MKLRASHLFEIFILFSYIMVSISYCQQNTEYNSRPPQEYCLDNLVIRLSEYGGDNTWNKITIYGTGDIIVKRNVYNSQAEKLYPDNNSGAGDDEINKYEYKIDRRRIFKIINKFYSIDFFSLKRKYTQNEKIVLYRKDIPASGDKDESKEYWIIPTCKFSTDHYDLTIQFKVDDFEAISSIYGEGENEILRQLAEYLYIQSKGF